MASHFIQHDTLARTRFGILFCFSMLISSPCFGQTPQDTSAVPKFRGIEFYEPVAFSEIQSLLAFVDTSDAILLAPSYAEVSPDDISVIYTMRNATPESGMLTFSVNPRLSPDRTDDEVLAFVRGEYPDNTVALITPRLVRAEAMLFGQRHILTPYTTTLPIGREVHFTIPLDRDALGFFLSARTTNVPVGGVSLILALRGYELGLDSLPIVSDRRIAITGHIDGGCAVREERYINARSGQSGCLVPIRYSRREVARAQQILQQEGLYLGPIDGLYGPLSVRAVMELQRRKDLPATGIMDFETFELITADKEIAEPPESGTLDEVATVQ